MSSRGILSDSPAPLCQIIKSGKKLEPLSMGLALHSTFVTKLPGPVQY